MQTSTSIIFGANDQHLLFTVCSAALQLWLQRAAAHVLLNLSVH